MKVIAALSLLLASSQAFTTPFGVNHGATMALRMSEAVLEAPVVEEAPAVKVAPAAVSEMDFNAVRKSIRKLSADNFSATLSKIEPCLLNEAGRTFYSKSMRRITFRAKELGLEVPSGYAKEAKATTARRAKQDAFIQQKIAAAAEAAAAAAEAAAAAAEEPAQE